MMRISTNMIYGQNMQRLSSLQAQLNKTQQHISANTRILTPADDPVGAARALDLKQGLSMNTQFASNRGMAGDMIKLEENALTSVVSRVQDIQTLLIAAGNGGYAEEQLRVTADEIRAIRDELVGYANTRDAFGDYIFSGHQTNVEPFKMAVTGQVTYQGDSGYRQIQVDAARFLRSSDPGSAVFMGIRSTTATTMDASRNDFQVGLSVVDESLVVPGNYYKVTFTGQTPSAQYQVELFDSSDTSLGVVATGDYTGRATEGITVVDGGVEITFNGAATATDWITVTPGEARRDDLFTFINEALGLLEGTNLKSNNGSSNLAFGLESALGNFATALDQILIVQGKTGTRLKELDSLGLAGMDKDLLYTESISEIEDLDYYKAISDLYMQQLTLQSAQKTFMQIQGLSLFNLM